jgi:hypothetical protein
MSETVGHYLIPFSVLHFICSRCWEPFYELSDRPKQSNGIAKQSDDQFWRIDETTGFLWYVGVRKGLRIFMLINEKSLDSSPVRVNLHRRVCVFCGALKISRLCFRRSSLYCADYLCGTSRFFYESSRRFIHSQIVIATIERPSRASPGAPSLVDALRSANPPQAPSHKLTQSWCAASGLDIFL